MPKHISCRLFFSMLHIKRTFQVRQAPQVGGISGRQDHARTLACRIRLCQRLSKRPSAPHSHRQAPFSLFSDANPSTRTREGKVAITRRRIRRDARYLLARVQHHTLVLPSQAQDARGRRHKSHRATDGTVALVLIRHDAAHMILLALSDCKRVSLPFVESARSIVQRQRIQKGPCWLPAPSITLRLQSSKEEATKEVVCVTVRRGPKGRRSVLSKSA